jgi:hypothetical protein
MKYNIQEEGNKLILEVELSPYRTGDKRVRRLFNSKNAVDIIAENNYRGYTLYKEPQDLDNKFTSIKGTYIFVKETENKKTFKNNIDTSTQPVLKSSKRRRQKNATSTVEK